jgi:hypothetical protein
MRTVALFTNSLVVSSIGASLEGRAGLQVVRVDPALPGAMRRLSRLRPDIAIVDLSTAQSDLSISLVRQNPGLMVIGVGPSSKELLVLSGHTTGVLTTDDLVQLIEQGSLAKAQRVRGQTGEREHKHG